jgi:hypothetical protein
VIHKIASINVIWKNRRWKALTGTENKGFYLHSAKMFQIVSIGFALLAATGDKSFMKKNQQKQTQEASIT